MRSLLVAGAALVLAAGFAPPVPAHEGHCVDVFVLSGVDTGDGTFVGTNPGAVSCTVDEPTAHPDTNYTVPGALHARAALFDTFPEPTGTMTIGAEAPIELTFVRNEVRGRWESQSVALAGVGPGTTLTATLLVADEPQSVVYTRI